MKSVCNDKNRCDSERLIDTLIVGAGLAGLSTAYELRDTSLMLIEKNDYPGGRVCTRVENDIVYELGALFAHGQNLLPFERETSSLIQENGPIGLYHNDTVLYGHSGLECLLKTGIMKQQLEQLVRATPPVWPLPAMPMQLNALFRVIHPGNMVDYVPQRWQDALMRFETHHHEKGNQELVAALAKALASPILMETETLSVEEFSDCVKTTFRQADQIKSVFSKTAVVSTPAPVAKKIVVTLHEDCRIFLNSLRYGEGTVVIIGCKDVVFHDFSYIVTPQLPVNTIFKYRTHSENITVLVVYYVAEKSARLQGKEEREVVSQVLDILAQIHPYTGTILEDDILFSKMHRWEHVGPIISSEAYERWTLECRRPSKRVFLCGDYQYVDHENLMPYGMTAAILSGRQTANAVREFLFGQSLCYS